MLETISRRLPQLVKLKIQNCWVSSISILENFPKLQLIDLSSMYTKNNVDLLTIPSNLTDLRIFTLERSSWNNFSSLCRFPSLEELNLCGNEKIDLGTLPTNLLQLRKLNLCGCHLRNVSALSRFPNLEECDLSENISIYLNTIPSSLVRLRKLCLRRCFLTRPPSLSNFLNLQEILYN
jgi:hypothetical protein